RAEDDPGQTGSDCADGERGGGGGCAGGECGERRPSASGGDMRGSARDGGGCADGDCQRSDGHLPGEKIGDGGEPGPVAVDECRCGGGCERGGRGASG